LALINRNYERAKKLLNDNIDILHAMTDALIKYETLDSDQLDQLMAREAVQPPKDWEDDADDTGSGKVADAKEEADVVKKDKKKPIVGGPAEQPWPYVSVTSSTERHQEPPDYGGS